MTKAERIRFYMFIRVIRFIADNIADFAAGGIVAAQNAVLQTVVATLETLTGEQISGLNVARYMFNTKDTARENLRHLMSEISDTARSMVYEFPGIDLKFRMVRGNNDANLLALARSFLTETTPIEGDFIRYEMDRGFLTELQTLIDAFAESLDEPGAATDSHVEATADIGAEIRKGMNAVRTMNAPVNNKYKNDVGKLAAWLSATHLEKPVKDKEPTPPVS